MPLDPTDLLEVGPRRPDRPGASGILIQGGVGQGPENPQLVPPMPLLWAGVHGGREAPAPGRQITDVPDGQQRNRGPEWSRLFPEGKKLRPGRPTTPADFP